MAVVYLALQSGLEREVALKVLRPGLAVEGRHVDRFKREELSVARLKHPHIVAVYAVGESLGYHYLAMEYVAGRTLAEILESLPPIGERTSADLARATGMRSETAEGLSYERALCNLLAPVVRALGTAHEIGIVHRDVKPSNILVHSDGRAVIADFGLAKSEGDPGLSLSGEPLGTPFYMSPEQAALTEQSVDERTDVYSLGVTLYEALAGRRPFEGNSVIAVLDAVRHEAAPPLRVLHKRTSRDAEAVCRRAMAKRPSERYPSALELAVDLTALAEGASTQALVREGGLLRRFKRGWSAFRGGEEPEFVSELTFLGWPLVHVVSNRRAPGQPLRVAKGWIAAGPVAIGAVACGGVACGGLTWGGFSIGIGPIGGFAVGLVPLGGFALGYLAIGGFALGWGAVGGIAIGEYAFGGMPFGPYTIGPEGAHSTALAWFEPWRWLLEWVPGLAQGLSRYQ